MKPRIAFIGATGMLGKPVAEELMRAGFEVSALVRDPAKARQMLPAGIEAVKGDLKKANDVNAFFKGKNFVYLNLSIKQNEPKSAWHSESEGMKIILDAAKNNNIQRIGYLSSIVMFYQGMNGFNWWVFEFKHKAVEMIKQSGIPYSVFYPSNFMESLNNMYRSGNRMLLAGKSNSLMYFIAANDYGKQVAAAFQHNSGNKEYCIQGPEAYIADDAVKEFANHYTKGKLIISKAPLGIIKFFGLFNARMNYGGHILEALNNYPEKFVSQNTWDELGKPTTTIKQYAANCN